MVDTLYDDLDPFFPLAPEKDSDTEESLDYDDTEETNVTKLIQHYMLPLCGRHI